MDTQIELKKYYLWQHVEFNDAHGYPFGKDLFYECQICRQFVPSLPDKADRDIAAECVCGNVIVDADAGRIYVSKSSSVKLYRRKRRELTGPAE